MWYSARHRAATAPLTWAARSLITATTVPVGALAGCVVAAVAASAQNPGLGIAGLAAAGVPLTLREVRARRAARRTGRTRGRHVAGLEQLWPAAGAATTEVRLDPAVDPAEPSPTAFRVLSLVPVAGAETRTEVVAAATEAVVLAIPSPRAASDAGEVAEVVVPAARAEVVVRLGVHADDVTVLVEAPEPSQVAPQQRAAEIAQLNRLWAAGTGPDTGSLRTTASAA